METARMRNRHTNKVNHKQSNDHRGTNNYRSKSKEGVLFISELSWFTICLSVLITMGFVHIRSYTFPHPKTIQEARPGEFVEERARKYLNDITSLGPREVGSEANEIHVVKYLLEQLRNIKERSSPVNKLDIDVQLTSGTFTLKFLGEFSSVYENMKNVIVKMGPTHGANHSLLVNCHYDSVLDSPGASDDAVTCSLMLEVLDILSQEGKPLLHNVIFIFNGAEENILQASHGFITQHPWAEDIRAFINLDSAGAGGRELLFQAGPEHPWLIQAYAQNVPHPFASTFGQEVFESGFIPSDTDFRIYRDYGNIPGVDIAYIHNGYVYHTKWDSPEMIPSGCMQRGGENLLALVKALADSPLLADPGEFRHGEFVFFDVVGLFIVLYPARLGVILNTFTVVVVLVGIMRKMMGTHDTQGGLPGRLYLRYLLRAVAVIIGSWVGTLLCLLALGYTMHLVDRPMSWYSRPWMIAPLYMVPAVAASIGIHSLAKAKLYKNVGSYWDIESIFFDASQLIMSAVLATMTFRGINSAVLFLISVLSPLLVRGGLVYILDINFKDNTKSFVAFHLLGTALPTLLKLYFLHGVLDMFVPVMGRIGTNLISDMFIAGVVTFLFLLIISDHMSLVYVTRSIRPVLTTLGLISLVTFVMVIFTPLGFPYENDPQAPSRQRQIIHHIDRTFHDVTGGVTKKDSGLWLIPFDSYALTPLKDTVPMLDAAKPTPCEGPYCGWPYYFPMLCLMRYTFYIPREPLMVEKPRFTVLNRTLLTAREERIYMEISGPNHIIIYLSPKTDVSLIRWSVGNGVPHPTQMPPAADFDTFFIYYSYGTRPERPWQFWIDVEVEEGTSRSAGVLDIAVSGHYWFGDARWTPAIREYLRQLPDWSFPVAWTATYEAWVL